MNNTRTYLSVVLKEAVQRGRIARKPCARVPQLWVDPGEIDDLRRGEVNGYLDACGTSSGRSPSSRSGPTLKCLEE